VPLSLPVWFVAIDESIYLSTPERAKKVLRLRRDPRCSFAVESGRRWAELCGVSMTGTATILAADDASARRGQAEIEAKYAAFRTARSDMPAATSEAYEQRGRFVVIRFDPDDKILSWNNSALGL
jgi:nitroimidazol reductase NimA-like FMN-containing flavoprotein (pyridoxamine 5'-phosphate oxidase superfamily)